MRRTLLFLFILPVVAFSQEVPWQTYALFGSTDYLSEDDALLLEHLLERPININSASSGDLSSCGLFTAYQVASLLDYRALHGPVLSVTELSFLDGFGEYFAKAVAPYLDFSLSEGPPSKPLGIKLYGRYGLKNGASSWKGKLSFSAGAFASELAARALYSDKSLWPPTGRAAYLSYSKGPWKIILGDYNLRLGQGLCLWSGLVFSGATSPLSLYKRGTSLSGSASPGGTAHRGAAASYKAGDFILTGFYSSVGLSGGNATYLMPMGQVGLTAYARRAAGAISADARFCLDGKDLFAELCLEPGSKGFAGVAGVVFPLWERGRLGFAGRCYTPSFSGIYSGGLRAWSKNSDEIALTASYGAGEMSFCIDVAGRMSRKNRQVKASYADSYPVSPSLKLNLLARYRYRDYEKYRTHLELRPELCYADGSWKINLRGDAVLCKSLGLLSYLEGALEKTGTLWLRGTLFKTDAWEDRIYTYERDAPGGFIVPAWYGRGWAASVYMKRKLTTRRRWELSAYLRGSYIGYWHGAKPSVTELRFTFSWGF